MLLLRHKESMLVFFAGYIGIDACRFFKIFILKGKIDYLMSLHSLFPEIRFSHRLCSDEAPDEIFKIKD